MDVKSCFTVMFEEPFWIGLYERWQDGSYSVCKITFGAEPKDGEVYEFFLKNYRKFVFSPAVKMQQQNERRINPKRMKRKIDKQLSSSGVGTKAQQALGLMREQNKLEQKNKSKQQREEEKQRQFELHQQKQKEKHKGH